MDPGPHRTAERSPTHRGRHGQPRLAGLSAAALTFPRELAEPQSTDPGELMAAAHAAVSPSPCQGFSTTPERRRSIRRRAG